MTFLSPSPKPRVIFINRFYRPEEPVTGQLATDVAEGLAARGYEVLVITRQSLDTMPREEILNGVRVLRVRSTRSNRGGLLSKALDFGSFLFGAVWRVSRVARRGDALVALTDPPLLSIGVWAVARLRGARLFHWVQDIYPELAIELAGQTWLRVLQPLRDLAWRGAESCVTLGHDMAAVLLKSRVAKNKIALVPNWAPAGLESFARTNSPQLRSDWGVSGKFVVAYSGNFGRVHDLLPLLAVADALREEQEIAFVLIGDGAQRRRLAEGVARLQLRNVSFHPLSRSRLGETLALGDIHLVTLLPGCERFVFPSKTYGIAAVGRPVLFLGPTDCEVARLVQTGGFGYAFAAHEVAKITAAIRAVRDDTATRERLGRAALEFSTRTGGANAAIASWAALLAPARELAASEARA